MEYADDEAVKEANDKYKADMDAAARARFAEEQDDEDDDEDTLDLDEVKKTDSTTADEGDDDEEDLLDKLTGNVDDEEAEQVSAEL